MLIATLFFVRKVFLLKVDMQSEDEKVVIRMF